MRAPTQRSTILLNVQSLNCPLAEEIGNCADTLIRRGIQEDAAPDFSVFEQRHVLIRVLYLSREEMGRPDHVLHRKVPLFMKRRKAHEAKLHKAPAGEPDLRRKVELLIFRKVRVDPVAKDKVSGKLEKPVLLLWHRADKGFVPVRVVRRGCEDSCPTDPKAIGYKD